MYSKNKTINNIDINIKQNSMIILKYINDAKIVAVKIKDTIDIIDSELFFIIKTLRQNNKVNNPM